jgi:hypothetical protein
LPVEIEEGGSHKIAQFGILIENETAPGRSYTLVHQVGMIGKNNDLWMNILCHHLIHSHLPRYRYLHQVGFHHLDNYVIWNLLKIVAFKLYGGQ